MPYVKSSDVKIMIAEWVEEYSALATGKVTPITGTITTLQLCQVLQLRTTELIDLVSINAIDIVSFIEYMNDFKDCTDEGTAMYDILDDALNEVLGKVMTTLPETSMI